MGEFDEAQTIDAIEALMPPLLTTLDALGQASRYLHPPVAGQLATWVAPTAAPLAAALQTFDGMGLPAALAPVANQALGAARLALASATDFSAAATGSAEPMGLYRALRKSTLAIEQLFPLAQVLVPVSRFFVVPESRDDVALLERLHQGAMRADDVAVGILNGGNGRDQRGGFSLYVPEYYSAEREWPMIVALHGGSGHGADFLWSWVREARTRGALVAAVTSRGRTWSIMDENDIDAPNLLAIVQRIANQNGGSVDVSSTRGEGSIFSLILPTAPPEP